MTVTRREMLTAASAIGLAAGLNQESEAALKPIAAANWHVIPRDYGQHLERAAYLVCNSSSGHFPSFAKSDFDQFFNVFDKDTGPDYKATVNGIYDGDQLPNNLSMLYSIRKRRDSDLKGVSFVLHTVGGQYGTPGQAAEVLYTNIRAWLTSSGLPGSKYTKIHYRWLQENSFNGEMLRYIVRDNASNMSLTDNKDGYWKLTIKA